MPQESKKLRDEFKTGTFLVDEAPNPVKVVIEHSKTLITISTAFMALVASFSDKLLSDAPSTFYCWLFGILWLALLAALFCGVVSAQWLHQFILWPSEDKGVDEAQKEAKRMHNLSADAANIGPYCLLVAGVAAMWLSISKVCDGAKPLDTDKCTKLSIAYLNSFPGLPPSNWILEKMEWTESNKLCCITLKNPQITTAYTLTVDAKKGAVLSANRFTLGLANEGGGATAYPPFVITNIVQIPVISNYVQLPAITNIVQFPAISNFIQLPTITNNIQIQSPTPNSATNRRWGFGVGLGFGSERQK